MPTWPTQLLRRLLCVYDSHSEAMKHATLFTIALMLWLRLSAPCAAQLQWESRELEFSPSADQTHVTAHFKFQNVGQSEIKITSVSTSCGCTTAALEKNTIAPGEKGEIEATFNVGERVGLQQKTILVESTDPESPKTSLALKVHIPAVAQVRPSSLQWALGKAPSAQEINIKILNDFPIHAVSAISSDPRILARVEQTVPSKEYRVIVEPKGTSEPVTAVLTIKTDYPAENPKEYIAFVRIK
jgi:hypothetical protein